jgi:hypothetical protein
MRNELNSKPAHFMDSSNRLLRKKSVTTNKQIQSAWLQADRRSISPASGAVMYPKNRNQKTRMRTPVIADITRLRNPLNDIDNSEEERPDSTTAHQPEGERGTQALLPTRGHVRSIGNREWFRDMFHNISFPFVCLLKSTPVLLQFANKRITYCYSSVKAIHGLNHL